MQEHFNEKYLHSEEFPKASFTGTIADATALALTGQPTIVNVSGTL